MSYLTQVEFLNQNREEESQAIKAARAESSIAHEEYASANARAHRVIAEITYLKR